MIRSGLFYVTALALTLQACATPEARLRNGLVEAGLAEPTAACIAERMADRLSLLQMKRLGGLATLEEYKDKRLSGITLERFLYDIRALKDPEILAVATTSAGICALR